MPKNKKHSQNLSVRRTKLNPDIRTILDKSGYDVNQLYDDLICLRSELKGFFDPDLLQVFDAASLVVFAILHPEFDYDFVKFDNGRFVPVRRYYPSSLYFYHGKQD